MRTTMHMKDLKKADGFPDDIDRTEVVIVSQPTEDIPAVLYTSKTGEVKWELLHYRKERKFAPGNYIIYPK